MQDRPIYAGRLPLHKREETVNHTSLTDIMYYSKFSQCPCANAQIPSGKQKQSNHQQVKNTYQKMRHPRKRRQILPDRGICPAACRMCNQCNYSFFRRSNTNSNAPEQFHRESTDSDLLPGFCIPRQRQQKSQTEHPCQTY